MGGPGGRGRTLSVKRRKTRIYLLVMPKYWGKQIFTLGRFPEVGQKQKTEREKKEEKERLNDGNIITMAKLRMVHASTHGARKPPGPKQYDVINTYMCCMLISEVQVFFQESRGVQFP